MKPMHGLMAIGIVGAFVLAFLFAGTGGDPEPKAPEPTDFEKMQGVWIGDELGGKPGEWQVVVDTSYCEVVGPGRDEWYAGRFELNPEPDPKHFTMTIEEAWDERAVGQVTRAVYEIRNGVLRLASREPGHKDRPENFTPKRGVRVFAFQKLEQDE